MTNIIGIIFLATFIEGLITYLFGEKSPYQRPWLRYVSLVLGVGAALAYKIDIPAMAGLVTPWPFVGYVISGIGMGRGANYLNDIFGLIQAKKSDLS